MAVPRIDLMFKAFADPTRLRLLHLLVKRRELCVCDFKDILRIPQPKVSRHLAYLRKAGLVVDRKEGLWRYYSLAKPAGSFHRKVIGCLGTCFREVGDFRKDLRMLGRSAGNGRKCA